MVSGYPLVNIQIAIENMAIFIVSFPIKNGGSFHSYVSLPEGMGFPMGFSMVFPVFPWIFRDLVAGSVWRCQ